MDIETPSKVIQSLNLPAGCKNCFSILGSNLFLLFNSQSHILAMDTLSATTAGVDAAKGKTLEEMSDVVGVVSYIIQYS